MIGLTVRTRADDPVDVDGLALLPASAATPASGPAVVGHPNGALALDHLVLATPDLERTTAALGLLGWKPRRTAEMNGHTYRFFLVPTPTGRTVVEVIQPDEPEHPDASTTCWGLAIEVADLPAACDLLGEERISGPRQAIQPGRQIGTVRGSATGITTAVALMSPRS